MTLLSQGFLRVSYAVSCLHARFPIFGAGNRTPILGNFLKIHALGGAFHGFLLQKLVRDRKPEVSSWIPTWFPNRRDVV